MNSAIDAALKALEESSRHLETQLAGDETYRALGRADPGQVDREQTQASAGSADRLRAKLLSAPQTSAVYRARLAIDQAVSLIQGAHAILAETREQQFNAAQTAATAPVGFSATIPPQAKGPPQDLTRIRRISKEMAARLGQLGVTRYDDIAHWRRDDVVRIAKALDLGREISRQNWIEQAALLAGPELAAAPSASRIAALQAPIAAAMTLIGAPKHAGTADTDAVETNSVERAAVATPDRVIVTGAQAGLDTALDRRDGSASAGVSMQTRCRPDGHIRPAPDVLRIWHAAEAVAREAACAARLQRPDRLDGAGPGLVHPRVGIDAALPPVASSGHIGEEFLERAASARPRAEIQARAKAAAERCAQAAARQAGKTASERLASETAVANEQLVSAPAEAEDLTSQTSRLPLQADTAASLSVAMEAIAPDRIDAIRGIDAGLASQLGAMGVDRYLHMAQWSTDDVARISGVLGIDRARIAAQNWIEQAALLAGGRATLHAQRWARGEFHALVRAPVPLPMAPARQLSSEPGTAAAPAFVSARQGALSRPSNPALMRAGSRLRHRLQLEAPPSLTLASILASTARTPRELHPGAALLTTLRPTGQAEDPARGAVPPALETNLPLDHAAAALSDAAPIADIAFQTVQPAMLTPTAPPGTSLSTAPPTGTALNEPPSDPAAAHLESADAPLADVQINGGHENARQHGPAHVDGDEDHAGQDLDEAMVTIIVRTEPTDAFRSPRAAAATGIPIAHHRPSTHGFDLTAASGLNAAEIQSAGYQPVELGVIEEEAIVEFLGARATAGDSAHGDCVSLMPQAVPDRLQRQIEQDLAHVRNRSLARVSTSVAWVPQRRTIFGRLFKALTGSRHRPS